MMLAEAFFVQRESFVGAFMHEEARKIITVGLFGSSDSSGSISCSSSSGGRHVSKLGHRHKLCLLLLLLLQLVILGLGISRRRDLADWLLSK